MQYTIKIYSRMLMYIKLKINTTPKKVIQTNNCTRTHEDHAIMVFETVHYYISKNNLTLEETNYNLILILRFNPHCYFETSQVVKRVVLGTTVIHFYMKKTNFAMKYLCERVVWYLSKFPSIRTCTVTENKCFSISSDMN